MPFECKSGAKVVAQVLSVLERWHLSFELRGYELFVCEVEDVSCEMLACLMRAMHELIGELSEIQIESGARDSIHSESDLMFELVIHMIPFD